jgi:protein-tyrosine phosphatase
MAEALLRHRLTERGIDAHVHSAGLLEDGEPASRHGVDLLADRGIDLSTHRSRRMAVDMLRDADLVLGMARRHVREAVVLAPETWFKTYTLKELVRRGDDLGGRTPGQALDDWLEKLHAGRTRSDLLGDSPADDVFDPIGSARSKYEEVAAELDALLARTVDLAFPAQETA